MATEPYVSPYTVDERTRRSVMAAQENKSIAEVYERGSRRFAPPKYRPFLQKRRLRITDGRQQENNEIRQVRNSLGLQNHRGSGTGLGAWRASA